MAVAPTAAHPHAFAGTLELHRPVLVRYARSLLRDTPLDAEDVVQDVHERLLLASSRGLQPVVQLPYLLRAVRNRSIDLRRRAQHTAGPQEYQLAAAGGDPADVIADREAIAELLADLGRLPEAQREALVRHVIGGAHPEGKAGGEAMKSLVFRARRNLWSFRFARETPCHEIRAALRASEHRGVRRSELVRRHVIVCPACQAHLVREAAAAVIGPFVGWLASAAGAGPAKTLVVAGALGVAVAEPIITPSTDRPAARVALAPSPKSTKPASATPEPPLERARPIRFTTRPSAPRDNGSGQAAPVVRHTPNRERAPEDKRDPFRAHQSTQALSIAMRKADLARPEMQRALREATTPEQRRGMTLRQKQAAAHTQLSRKRRHGDDPAPASDPQPSATAGAGAPPAAPAPTVANETPSTPTPTPEPPPAPTPSPTPTPTPTPEVVPTPTPSAAETPLSSPR